MAALQKSTANPSLTRYQPYFQMISEAISSLKDRKGSSQEAISKFIEDKYSSQLPQNFNKLLSVQLNEFVKSQKLVKLKNSFYKISAPGTDVEETDESSQKEKVKTKRLSQVKTPEALKKKSTAKEAARDKEKTKMKRLSSIKTPDALKAKKKKKTNTPAVKRKASSKQQ